MKTLKYSFLAMTLLALSTMPVVGATMDFHDWSWQFSNSTYMYSNTSSAGSISGSSHFIAAQPGTFGIPYAITLNNMFTSEFQVNGTSGVGHSVDFTFSSGYAWGSGGQMILGNIHNYFEYTVSAWDFNNNPIDVNSWSLVAEYPSSAPGTLGYFSTSSTQHSATGNSENFFVNDPNADANGGQGGLLLLDGLNNVGRIQITLTASDLGQNAQQVDFFLFNVGTPTAAPEPGTLTMLGTGLVGLAGILRRKLMG